MKINQLGNLLWDLLEKCLALNVDAKEEKWFVKDSVAEICHVHIRKDNLENVAPFVQLRVIFKIAQNFFCLFWEQLKFLNLSESIKKGGANCLPKTSEVFVYKAPNIRNNSDRIEVSFPSQQISELWNELHSF